MPGETVAKLKDCIKTYPDFPKKGIYFKDIFPIFQDPSRLEDLLCVLTDHYKKTVPDLQGIVGLEARGFLLGPPLALKLNVPFIPIRKAGKLPGDVLSLTYDLEYGSDTCELQKNSITKGQKIVIIDDLLATGGTMKAAAKLVELAGGQVVECTVVMELVDLRGKDGLSVPFFSLLQF